MATSFENFVNTELPKRIATNESPTTPEAGDIPVFTGVGLLTESKTASEAGLATETFATNAANTAETNAKSYADDLITSIYKFQTTYNPQTTGNFPTTANTVGGVAIKKGFTWVVSGVTGQYTFRGVTVDNGDTLLALVDNASATSAADWHITEKNLGYTPENQANKVNDLTDSTSTAKYTSVKAVVDGLSGKQNTLPDVITAETYGSSTQWPKVTVNAKGIVTGVTLQTVPTPALTDATFSVQKDGSPSIAASWSLTALTSSRVHTYPNKDIDFGNLSFIATTGSNVLSGTRNRILGGRDNNVSGTDVVAIDCVNNSFAGNAGVIFNACYNSGRTIYPMIFPSGTIVNGTSQHPQIVLFDNQSFFGGAVSTTLGLCTVVLSANGSTYNITADAAAPSSTNSAKLTSPISPTSWSAAVHDVEFVVMFGLNTPLQPSRTFYAKRRVYVANHYSTGFTSSVEVVGTDTNLGVVAGTVTIGFNIDTTNNRLVPTISATGGLTYQVSCRINSHYNTKA